MASQETGLMKQEEQGNIQALWSFTPGFQPALPFTNLVFSGTSFICIKLFPLL